MSHSQSGYPNGKAIQRVLEELDKKYDILLPDDAKEMSKEGRKLLAIDAQDPRGKHRYHTGVIQKPSDYARVKCAPWACTGG